MQITEIPYDSKTGTISLPHLKEHLDTNTAGVYIENPNYFGIFEEKINTIQNLIQKHNTLFVVGIDPISLGIVKSPGAYGADIAIGEGRALGNPMNYGGSGLGLFCCKKDYLRQVPGRIIGLTKDAEGKRAFCMTMQTREQHIRRGRATSNICTNEGLNALNALIYLSTIGQNGLYELGKKNIQQAHELATKISALTGYDQVFSGTPFNEFVIRCPNAEKTYQHLLKNGIHGGLLLEKQYPDLSNCMLFGVTEMHTNEHLTRLLTLLQEAR